MTGCVVHFSYNKPILTNQLSGARSLNGYKIICLGIARSEIFGSAELRKREHENKTFSFFPPTPFRVPFTFSFSPLSESLKLASVSLGIYYTECSSDLKL